MAYINIPSLNYTNLGFSFVLKTPCEDEQIFMSNSLHHYLANIKLQIGQYNTYWDYYKKITNPYEFIHTHVPEFKMAICKHKPLSRSFFKMIEIINTFSFLTETKELNCFHLAEGPGGFIEAFNYTRNNKNDKLYGMTLISQDVNIPSWNKSLHYLNNNKNIIIEYGSSNTGDLFLKENLIYCNKMYAGTMDYITGDGGVDFSVDFNKQEELSIKLVIAQIFFAIIMQKTGGNFVLKIFDIFKFKTVEIIFLLSNLYGYVYIYKPYTSRVANSEKYIICKNYKNDNPRIKTEIINNFDYVMDDIDNIYSLFNITLPKLFIKKIEEINAIYGQQQIENINTTLNLIREYINIKHRAYISSDDDYDDDDNNYEIKQKLTTHTDVYHSTSITVASDDTELVSDLLNSNNSTYSSPTIINYETRFSFLRFDKFKLYNKEKPDNDTDNKSSSSNDGEEILCNKLKNTKFNNLSYYDKFTHKIYTLKNINIQKSVNWCNKYNFPMNKHFVNN
jgi:23S rRNA U2552 (ribose-2'-O)-methylase RlmE/FtsJ